MTDCGCRMTEPEECAVHPCGSRDCCRVVAPAQVPESGAPAASGATENAPGSPSAWGVLSEAERAMRSERALHAEMGRALTTAVALRQERDDAIAALSEARAERDAARTAAALAVEEEARLRERLEALAFEHRSCSGCPTPWWLTALLAPEPLTDATEGGE